ncbi:MAG: CRTAC1 family protein [Planctomycetota bacterium]|jgi:tetratricopeptide (TPR) repeat protein
MIHPLSVSMIIWLAASGLFMTQGQTQEELLAKGKEAVEAEDYRTAENAYRRVIQTDPRNVEALHRLARMYATASDPDYSDGKLSVELALMALDDSGDNPEIIDTLAMGYFAQNKFDRAIHECQRCIILNPYEPFYYRQLKKIAMTWMARLEMTHQGREVPEKARAAFYLGKAHFHLDEVDDALAALNRAYRTGGPRKDVCLYLARAKAALGDPEPAVEIIQSLGDDYTQDAELLFELGKVLWAAGNQEGATSVLEDAYSLDPDLEGLREELGALYLDTNKHVKAALMLQEAYENLDRSDPLAPEQEAEILYFMSRALAGGGEPVDGMMRLLEALSIKPDLANGENLLLTLYEQEFGSPKGYKRYLASLVGPEVVIFEEASKAAGITSTGRPAFGDYDGDGDPDLLLSGSRLFMNNGRGKFKEVTQEAGLEKADGDGGIFGDYDNDGDLDIYVVVNRAGFREKLFRNDGRQGFKDVSEEAGYPSDVAPTRAAVFGDVNRDGYLDLFLANGTGEGDQEREEYFDTLLLNDGRGGFKDATEEAGISEAPRLCGQGAVMADYDNDGDLDIYVANSKLGSNVLWVNSGKGRFEEEAGALGLAGREDSGRYGNSSSAAFGDVDGDGDLDLFVANRAEPRNLLFADTSLFYLNTGMPTFRFQNQSRIAGVKYDPGHYQSAFTDLNNDGSLDLYITCNQAGQSSRLYLGRGDGTFRDVSWISGTVVRDARGCAFADVDLDGDQDLFVEGAKRPYLYLNQGNGNHWLGLRLVGSGSNATAIGARVTLDYGMLSQSREVSGGRGSACQDDMVVHFGLGAHKGKVSASIQWPDGRTTFAGNLKPDRVHIIKAGR